MTREQLAVKIYTALLELYPLEFRQKYGADMLQVFRDSYRDADGKARFWLAALADLLVNALGERMKQMTTRNWLLKALSTGGAGLVFALSSFVLAFTVLLMSYFMLIPWDEGEKPSGSFAATVNNFFESDWILLPSFIVSVCLIIAVTRLTRKRLYSAVRIYNHFSMLNVAIIVLGAAVSQLSMILIGRIYPQPAPFLINPNYGTTAVYWGLIVIGALIAFFVRLALRPPTLPLTRQRIPPIAA